ncbi:UDP-N-acetylmuramate--L-alanine ligase [Trichinella spiralis]|uniref:UDP-N-acetylmuramate--L-alanine ligase n=1 Tax=Trichinella spiralis TaxID=6334 RepID=A0ABR3K4X9_TRISP
MKIYVPMIDKICLLQQIGIREEILNSMELFMSAASFKYCIAYSYSDFSRYNYCIFAYNEKARSCSPLYDLPEENIIDNNSEQLYDLQFYKVSNCLPAEGFMYSFEEELNKMYKINAVKLKATAEICIVERHPFSENFLLKRTGMFFLESLELCLAQCRVLSVRGKCHAVLFSGEDGVCLLLRQNQPLQSRDVMRKSASQFFTMNYCYYNMTESSQRRDYNVHEIPLLRKHMKQLCLLWKSKTLQHCIKFCARQYRANLCNAVYFEAEEKTCLHLLLNASQALHEYTKSKKETIHFIEKCVEVTERQEYQQESAINRIQSDVTSTSSPSRPRSSRTHNAREQQPDFFYYVASENVQERFAKLYEFFEICEMPTHMQKAYFMFGSSVLRTTSSMQKNIQRAKRQLILVHTHELVFALKGCFKDRPDERKFNAGPLVYYFKETQEICAVEIYKQKNLTSWKVMTIKKDVGNFQHLRLVDHQWWSKSNYISMRDFG